MSQLKYLAVAMLFLSVLTLHLSAPQKYIAYIPAIEDGFKVRPTDLEIPVAKVVGLEEANQRYEEQNHHE